MRRLAPTLDNEGTPVTHLAGGRYVDVIAIAGILFLAGDFWARGFEGSLSVDVVHDDTTGLVALAEHASADEVIALGDLAASPLVEVTSHEMAAALIRDVAPVAAACMSLFGVGALHRHGGTNTDDS